MQRSQERAIREGTAGSIMGGAGDNYLSAYALFLNASAQQIAFLAAVPALLGSLAQLVSGWVSHHTGRRKPLIIAGATLQALTWLPIIWLPYLFPAHAAAVFLGCVVFYYAGSNLAAPVWHSLLGDIVAPDERGRYFARRSRVMSLASFTALVGAGLVLEYYQWHEEAVVGFLIIFTTAMAARLYSAYQIARIPEPAPRVEAESRSFAALLRGLRDSHRFTRFSVYLLLMQGAAGIAGPFFNVYMLRDLHFSYIEFTLATASLVAAQFFTLRLWGRLSDAFGNRRILSVAGFMVPLLPLFWLFTTTVWPIVAIQFLSGVSWAGFNLSASNYVYDTVSPQRRSLYAALSSVLVAGGVFVGTTLGGFLARRLSPHADLFGWHLTFASSLWWLFLISALARFCASLAFIPRLEEARRVRHISPLNLLYKLSGASVIVGFFADLLTRYREL